MKKITIIAVVLLALAQGANSSMLDLTTSDSNGIINGALFQQYTPQPTGTGNFNSFVRIQANGTEEGYNTDGSPVWADTKTGTWTHSLLINSVEVQNIGGEDYKVFRLDLNESGSSKDALLSLDVLKIYLEATPNITGDPATSLSNLVYDMGENWIKLDYGLNGSQAGGGSGKGDMLAYIPVGLFTGSSQYVYLYSRFGMQAGCESGDGFEEWANAVIPEPTTLCILGIGILSLVRRKK